MNWCSDICALKELCMETFILNDMYSSSPWCMLDLCLGARNILVPLPFKGGTHPSTQTMTFSSPYTHLNHFCCH